MYNEQDLVARIASMTGYATSLTPLINADSIPIDKPLPLVYVGHLHIILDRQSKDDMFANGYAEREGNEVLLTEIQYICLNAEWATVREKIKDAYSLWSPFPNDSNYSSVFFVKAEKKHASGPRVIWSEVIGLLTPRVS